MWENDFISLTAETVTYNTIDFTAFYKHRISCALNLIYCINSLSLAVHYC